MLLERRFSDTLSEVTRITTESLESPGGSGKAEGLGDGSRAVTEAHRQAGACRCHPEFDDML